MKATFSRHLLTMWTSSARACSTLALLSFCSLAPCSARAEDQTPLQFDASTLQAVTNLARSLSASPAATTNTVADTVDSILSLLQSVLRPVYQGQSITTVPYSAPGSSLSMMRHLSQLLADSPWIDLGSYISQDKSYLYEIQRALYGKTGIPTADSAVIPLLLHLYGVTTNELPSIRTLSDSINFNVSHIDSMLYLLSDEYFIGSHPNMWDVHIDDFQIGDITDGFDWLGGYLSNVVEHVGADMGGYLSNIDPYVSDIASAVDAEYETGHMADEFEDSDDYIQDDLSASTNDLGQIEIDPGELPDTSAIFDGVDASEFNMLPSLSGADPVIEVFRADRASNLPAFSIDFSVPPSIYNLISLFCTWLWRVLFFVSMWRLVEGEYNYWTTLGGGA